MELTPATAEAYLRHAYRQMLAVADQLGEPAINVRPFGEGTNAVAALIVHCCGVTEYWLGHVALGRASTRDRDSEFTRTASLDELHHLVDATISQAVLDLAALDAGEGTDEGGRQFPLDGERSDTSVVIHVLEELYQHLGHLELTRDALTASNRP